MYKEPNNVWRHVKRIPTFLVTKSKKQGTMIMVLFTLLPYYGWFIRFNLFKLLDQSYIYIIYYFWKAMNFTKLLL